MTDIELKTRWIKQEQLDGSLPFLLRTYNHSKIGNIGYTIETPLPKKNALDWFCNNQNSKLLSPKAEWSHDGVNVFCRVDDVYLLTYAVIIDDRINLVLIKSENVV